MDIRANGQTDRQKFMQIDRHTCRQTDIRSGRQTDGHTIRQTDRRTDNVAKLLTFSKKDSLFQYTLPLEVNWILYLQNPARKFKVNIHLNLKTFRLYRFRLYKYQNLKKVTFLTYFPFFTPLPFLFSVTGIIQNFFCHHWTTNHRLPVSTKFNLYLYSCEKFSLYNLFWDRFNISFHIK